MIKKSLILLGIVSALSGLLLSGCHHGCHRSHGMTEDKLQHIEKHLASKLDLTADQKVKFSEIMKRFSARLPEMKKNREMISDSLIKQFESEKFNDAAVNTEFETAQKDFNGLRTTLVQSLSELHAILTPEQKKKVVAMLQKHRDKMSSK